LVDLNDVWIYVYEKGEARYTDLIKAFVDTGKRSKTVLLNYKTQLEAARKIAKKISDLTNRPVYYVPKRWQKEVEKLIKERELHSLIPSIDAKWLDPLRNILIRIKHEDPEVFFDRYCFTFIGDVPVAFTKSVEAMQSHLAFEKNLFVRQARDLEPYKEEIIKADKNESERIWERAREEVGLTLGEYLMKLLKKAENEKGVRKIMTVLGITEEMLKEMDKLRVQQERVYKNALLRILKKHQLSVDKPIKDRELLKTILKEYDQWKKEYREEKENTEKRSTCA